MQRLASILRPAAVLALAAGLTGCMAWPLDRQLTSATMLEPTPLDGYQYGIAEEKPLERAFIELPYLSGRPIAVREKRYANGVEQTIVLESEATADGENRVEVRVTQTAASDDRISSEYLQVRSSRQEQIRSDMKEFVWGVPMRILGSVEANAYGTYGYALGRSKMGFNCLLGWQNVKGVAKRKKTLGFMTSNKTEMSVRFRICRSDVSEEQLVAIIRGYRITFDPDALLQEPKMVWRNDGINISGTHGGDGAVPGYITEGLAPGAVPPAPDLDPVMEQAPVIRSAEPAPAQRSAPRQPAVRGTPQTRDPARRAPDVRRIPRQEEMVRQGDPSELNGLDPLRNKTTIFVDPREYAAVPLPGQVTGEGAQDGANDASRPAGGGGGSRFLVPGAPSGADGDTLNPQSQDARERRKQMVRQVPLSGETLSKTPAASGGQQTQGLFLAPEREGYRGLDVKDLQRSSRVQGDNAKHNLWLNDVARNDRDGLPLGRPCELMRDCRDGQPARAPSPAPQW
jgi:hypothetical protein